MPTTDHTLPLVRVILDRLATQYEMPVGVYVPGEQTIFSELSNRYFSPLCKRLEKNEYFKAKCEQDHLSRGANSTHESVEMCHCGLFNYSFPIIVEGNKVGTLLCGQRKIHTTDTTITEESERTFKNFLNSNKKMISNINSLRIAYDKVKYVDVEFFKEIEKDLNEAGELIFKVFFERKILERNKRILEKNVTNIAHEIQIYNQGAIAASSELKYFLRKGDTIEAENISSELEGSISHIGSVVTNLVWASSKMSYNYSLCNVHILLSDTVTHYRWFASSRNIDIRIENILGPPSVYCSEPHIRQVLNNLLHNAIKYSFSGNKMRKLERYVGVSCSKTNNDHIQLSFTNYGVGILKDEYDRILDDKYRGSLVENEDRMGTGLGLRVVKRIIENHKGNIEVKSIRQGRESYLNIFKVTFPYN